MTADSYPRVSSSESDSSTAKQRKKRKWDQPDESLVSTSVAVPGVFPPANVGSLSRITLPTVSSLAGASLAIPPPTSSATPVQAVQVPLQQHAAAIIQKLVQPKIQDELIAREIVINDADSAIRYKLTKRQTQEEIQKRGKYRPPYAPSDGERPLYLHISAATHLETTAERIKAVDHAAAVVEEMLKQATVSGGVKAGHLLTTSVFLGFEPDPSLDIISRIRGPNDQYVNHIMNATGATVLIRGRGSGYPDNGPTEETQQQLHLLLSSNNTNSLQHAKLLAENLLDTICGECGSSRISSCKVYGAVPPPPELQTGVHSPTSALSSTGLSQAKVSPACYPQGWTSGTSYNGYGGIYPQVTALQQVALALRQSTSPVTATVAPTITAASTYPQKEVPYLANDKRSQKRKFQELPVGAKGTANLNQGTEFPKPRELTSHVGARDILDVQEQKNFVKPSSSEMPPPPKFNSTPKLHEDNSLMQKSKPEAVPDTLIKLMEYGDDDDDDDEVEETAKLPSENHLSSPAMPKPFWAARK